MKLKKRRKNQKMKISKNRYLSGEEILPPAISPQISAAELIDNQFTAYNARRLNEICRLFTKKILNNKTTIGLSLSGALTPAGLGISCIIPLMRYGMIDWIVSTGANLYHDAHFAIGKSLHKGKISWNDVELRKNNVVRIFDVVFDYNVLLDTDAFFRRIIKQPEFQREMGSAEFHRLCGQYLIEREKELGLKKVSILAEACRLDIPVFTSSPGDSSIGMNIAAAELENNKLKINSSVDVNQTAAIVYNAKNNDEFSAVVILGGGSPKNFMLQTEPHIQEVLGLKETGHDYFIQITDARPDTGGLSGATPSEAVSWGKIDADKLSNTVVCYSDTTIALPLFVAYVLSKQNPRKPSRIYKNLDSFTEKMKKALNIKKRD